MRITIASAMLSTGLLVFTLCNAQAPSGSTGECKDGSYTSAASKSGACSGHGGVKDWYESAAPTKARTAPATAKTAAPAPIPAPAAPAASAPATKAATAPADSTGECKDGSYTSAASKSGACSGHGGVKDWYGNTAAKATPTPMAPKTAAPATPAAPAASAPATKTATAPMAAGGGPGQVWVNTNTKVYHCPGTRYYGKTKQGEYMTESAAKSAGDRPDHGKACS